MRAEVPVELLERAAARFERAARARAEQACRRPPRVITISRALGSGGRSISEILARSLHWPLWDKEILDVMARKSCLRYQARMFESLDETTQSGIDSALYAMLGGIHKDVYFYLLPRAILTIAQNDAIILGRGAHILLPNSLRVMLTASLELRIRRMAVREGISEKDALVMVKNSDREREAFLKELVARMSHASGGRMVRTGFDLTVDTDTFTFPQAASIILHAAAHKFGLGETRVVLPEIRELATA